MRRVIIESPYKGDIERNVTYARQCLNNSINRGEAPIASHLLYTQPGVLRDTIPDERKLGIAAGLAWRWVAECQVFYTDLGWSDGMLNALHEALKESRKFELRSLHGSQHVKIPATLDEYVEKLIREAVKD